MSRVTEATLQGCVDTLNERYPGHELRLQTQGQYFGVFANKPGRWLIEGMPNGDLRDAITGMWGGVRLENNRLLALLRKAREGAAEYESAENVADYLVEALDIILKEQRYDGW